MASVIAKKANHDVGLDRISNLPDSVLSCILSLLPIKYAVSTSILSTRWRYLYASVFDLNVNLFHSSHSPHTIKSFKNFLDKMLFFHTDKRIERFRLSHIDISKIDSSRVFGWISAAVWRGVKELDLDFCHISNSNNTPSLHLTALFFSKTLVRLKLCIPFLLSVPVHVFLPSLKTLELQYIEFEEDDSVKRLISSCPILQDLSIFNCDMQNIACLEISNPSLKSLTMIVNMSIFSYPISISIDLPSLVYFKYEDSIAQKYSTLNMPALVTANISVGDIEDRLVQLFEGIGNVKALHMTIFPDALPVLSHKRLAAFENLVQLQIDEADEWEGMGLFEFFEFSPNLQTLVICKLPNKVSIPMEKVPSCLLYKLKEFKVLDYEHVRSLFRMVTYILRNARVLEEVTVCIGESLKVDDKFKITKALLRLPRSSNTCHVVVL